MSDQPPSYSSFNRSTAADLTTAAVSATGTMTTGPSIFGKAQFDNKHVAYVTRLKGPPGQLAEAAEYTATILQIDALGESTERAITSLKLIEDVTRAITTARPHGLEDSTEDAQLQQHCADALSSHASRQSLADMSIENIFKFEIYTEEEHIDVKSSQLTPVFKWDKPQSVYGSMSGFWTLSFQEMVEDASWRAGSGYKVLLRMLDDDRLAALRSKWTSGLQVMHFP